MRSDLPGAKKSMFKFVREIPFNNEPRAFGHEDETVGRSAKVCSPRNVVRRSARLPELLFNTALKMNTTKIDMMMTPIIVKVLSGQFLQSNPRR
jgi:hypothetical protein